MKFSEKILKRAKEINSRLIFNLDVEKSIGILDEIYPYIAACKVNRTLTDVVGMDIVKNLRKKFQDIVFIADFKLADIPHTNEVLSRNAKNTGFNAITAHAFIGSDAIISVKQNLDVLLVVAMSHEGAKEYISKNTEKFCELALNLNIDAVVAPATRVEEIRNVKKILKDKAFILSPGVGVQGGNFGDAVKNGADFEMVGRTIYEAKDATKLAKEIYEKLPFERNKIKEK